MQAFFPKFNEWLADIPDPRREHPSKEYPLPLLFWLVMQMFVAQPGSRRQHDLDCATEPFLLNLMVLAEVRERPERVPTAETADDLLQKIAPVYIHELRRKMVHSLIRAKRLDECRWRGYWRLVADGTGLYTFNARHCPHCQTRRSAKTGAVTYYHNVLEFKLVSPQGFAISIHSEFIVNQDGETKQDSELKAFYRAAPKIRQEWPRMAFILLGDGIYANANVMRLCETYGWAYCFSLKDNLPTLLREALERLNNSNAVIHVPENRVRQEIRWAENLFHENNRCHALQCDETTPGNDGEPKHTRFLWITNLRPSIHRPVEMVREVGRQRWKIENQGFNAQKNGGYNLEHGYGVTGHAWQNYYLIIQIVHMIMQLVLRTDAIHKLPSRRELRGRDSPPSILQVFKSVKNLVKRLAEAFRYFRPTWQSIAQFPPFQLRFLDTG